MHRMSTAGAQTTWTFFFMTDLLRATDRTAEQTWAVPATSSSAPRAWGWAAQR
jgi:hypothetical protein